eukprot:791222-Rhodomonas_salina.2
MMPGMGLDRDKNTYYWPEYQYVANGEWEFRNYDMNGSYLVGCGLAFWGKGGCGGEVYLCAISKDAPVRSSLGISFSGQVRTAAVYAG